MESSQDSHEFREAFRAYSNYLEDLAGVVGGRFGMAETLLDGVYDTVLAMPRVQRIQRQPLRPDALALFQESMRKSWGFLRRSQREVEDHEFYDVEANAFLPYSAYYGVYHAIGGLAVASRQRRPRDHATTITSVGRFVRQGFLPFPWGAWCSGCPQVKSESYGGLEVEGSVHVLSKPDPDTSEERLALLLKTTRQLELDRLFKQERKRKPAEGRARRNLTKEYKLERGEKAPATTLFNVFRRLREKSSYGEADAFVLGATDEIEARRFGQALVLVTDGTVAALEGLIAAYAGPRLLAETARHYTERTGSTLIARRAEHWEVRAGLCVKASARAAPFDEDIPF